MRGISIFYFWIELQESIGWHLYHGYMVEIYWKIPWPRILQKNLHHFYSVKIHICQNILDIINKDPFVELVGYKMVDGNHFGLVLKLEGGSTQWFFEEELSETLDRGRE